MSYRLIESIPTEEIKEACQKARCFRQVNAVLKCHLLRITDLVDRVVKEGIDFSHFNKGEAKCSKCGNPLQEMRILDFDDVARKMGRCVECNRSEWIEDGGDIIDAWHYFKEGYKDNKAKVIGHTDI